MCGRFTLKTPPAQWGQLLLPQMDAGLLDVSAVMAHWRPRYNIAPTQSIAAIRSTESSGLAVDYVRWGLVPFWADDLAIGNRMINARSETLAEKPAFRNLLGKRRCAIVSDGYYEWQKREKAKQPFWIRRSDQRVFAFVGLWDSNRKASDTEVPSATIITASASDALTSIHDRMPIILPPDELVEWLDPSTTAARALELFDARDVDLEAQPVSTHVNNPRNEDATCIEPDQASL